jgi:hypothetical protein
MLTATNPLLCNMTVTLLWKCNELIVTQQELLRYYSNATTDLTCHNTYIYIYIYIYIYLSANLCNLYNFHVVSYSEDFPLNISRYIYLMRHNTTCQVTTAVVKGSCVCSNQHSVIFQLWLDWKLYIFKDYHYTGSEGPCSIIPSCSFVWSLVIFLVYLKTHFQ